MQLLEDGAIAVLAALGLVTLCYALISALLRPRRRETNAAVLVPCRAGGGAQLEATVRALERARYEYGGFRHIVILDRGMDAHARAVAAVLCREAFDVTLCGEDDLSKEN